MKGRCTRVTVTFLIGLFSIALAYAAISPLTMAADSAQRAWTLASPVGSAFTYQGYLSEGDFPANGAYDFQFKLFDAATAGNQLGSVVSVGDVTVADGLFTVLLDFGSAAFNGEARWLEIGVRPGNSNGAYTILSPRQALTPVPYAFSLSPGATISGTVSEGILNLTNSGGHGVAVDADSGYGVHVKSAGLGMYVTSAVLDGVLVDSAGSNGVSVQSADANGMYIASAGSNGVNVFSATQDGVKLSLVGGDGVRVDSAGNPSATYSSPSSSGFEVAGAEGDGLYVGRADNNGVHVNSSGNNGVFVSSAGNFGMLVSSPGDDGVYVGSAGGNGVFVNSPNYAGVLVSDSGTDGFYVNYAGDNGIEVRNAFNLAGYFVGDVTVTGTCTGCALAVFGTNSSDQSLQPGTIVSLNAAYTPPEPLTGAPILMAVGPASASQPPVGVVVGRAELDAGEEEGDEQPHLVPREGAAAPGEYVTILIYGLAQVHASALDAPITAGDRLTVDQGGAGRALQTAQVATLSGGTTWVAESSPTVGVALEELAAGEEGLIWILVGKQ